MTPSSRGLRVLFWAYAAITFVHIAYVVNHEPFAFDAWNIATYTDAKPATLSRFFAFWHQQYTSFNPRIGQPFAYLAYKLVGAAEIGTPLAFFAIVLGGFVLGTRRFPKLANPRDLAVLAIGIGFMWFAAPNMPAYMFCRAYATNYVWVAAIELWFVVALTLRLVESPAPATIGKLAGIAVLGVLAGMGNEHVGPTLLLFAFGVAAWQWRRGRRDAIVWVGAIAAFVGYALLFFAPGQNQRYEGLAERYTVTQQVLVRGLSGNVAIFQDYLFAIAPLALLLVAMIAMALRGPRPDDDARDDQRRSLLVVLVLVAAGSLITMTVFASPLLGPRFYMHACFLMLAGVIGVASAFLRDWRSLRPFVALAVVASLYAIARTVPLYHRLDRASDARLATLEQAPQDRSLTLGAWEQISESWWTLGDDVRDQKKQEMIASYFGLPRVLFRGNDLWISLGVTDVKLTMHYDLDPPACLDEVDALDLKPYVGRDIGALHHAFLDHITEIRRVVHAKLSKIDLVATFVGTPPPMPRDKIYVARWADGTLEGYESNIKRIGTTRQLTLSPELRATPMEMYVAAVGDPPKRLGMSNEDKPLQYTPWTSGTYWFLACRADACFVTYVTVHKL